MENYVEWKLMKCKKRMKNDVVPHNFDCQEDRKRNVSQPESPAAVKRRRQQLVAECLDPGPSTSSALTAIQEEEAKSDPISEEPSNKSIGIQVNIKPSVRSKGTQCNIQTPMVCQGSSPLSIQKKDVALTPIKQHLFKRKPPFGSSDNSETVTSGSSSSSPTKHHTTETGGSSGYENIVETENEKKIAVQRTYYIIERNPTRYLGILKACL